jgi:hypothetical protein
LREEIIVESYSREAGQGTETQKGVRLPMIPAGPDPTTMTSHVCSHQDDSDDAEKEVENVAEAAREIVDEAVDERAV